MDINFIAQAGEIYVCYLDSNNRLSIFTNESIVVVPFESKSRRLYLYGTDLKNKIYFVECLLEGFNKYGYDVTLSCNKYESNYNDYVFDFDTFIIDDNNPAVLGTAIPLDILLTSHNSNNINTNLVIRLDIKNL